jgi:two component transcriptional regulator, winged helix family
MKRILIVEDDVNILDIVAFNLEAAGYQTVKCERGDEGLKLLKEQEFDLAILDIMLPAVSGLEILAQIRKISDIPIILMSAKTSEEDKLAGFSSLADDYITKPFSVKELVARVGVHLMRYSKQRTLTSKGLELDHALMRAYRDGRELKLSKTEFEILSLLFKNRGKVFSREQLLKEVWGYDQFQGDLRTVDVAIARLRAKVEDSPGTPQIIKSRRGAGYYIDQ